MATTGKLEGTLWLFYVDGVAISHSQSGSVEFSTESRNLNTKDSGIWNEIAPTIISGSGSCDGLVALDATYGIEQMFTAMKNRTKIGLKFSTNVKGDKYFSGNAYIMSMSADAPDKDNTTYSVSFEFTGEVSHLTNT